MSVIAWTGLNYCLSGSRLDKHGLLREDELSLYLLSKGTIANADFDPGDIANDEGLMFSIGLLDAVAAWVFFVLSLLRSYQIQLAAKKFAHEDVNVAQYSV